MCLNNIKNTAVDLILKFSSYNKTDNTVKIPIPILIKGNGSFEVYELNLLKNNIANAISIIFSSENLLLDLDKYKWKEILIDWYEKRAKKIVDSYNSLRDENTISIIINIPIEIYISKKNNTCEIEFSEEVKDILLGY